MYRPRVGFHAGALTFSDNAAVRILRRPSRTVEVVSRFDAQVLLNDVPFDSIDGALRLSVPLHARLDRLDVIVGFRRTAQGESYDYRGFGPRAGVALRVDVRGARDESTR